MSMEVLVFWGILNVSISYIHMKNTEVQLKSSMYVIRMQYLCKALGSQLA